MVNKIFCMSSYLTFRYVEKEDVEFYEGLNHKCYVPQVKEKDKVLVTTAEEIDVAIRETIDAVQGKKGILLSGGMDSAILAAYMRGCDAYTFRFLGGDFQKEELERAEYYADYYGLQLHYVDIDWNTTKTYLGRILETKDAPVHPLEPQVLQAAEQAKADGVEVLIIGESSDLVFGGMDQLLSRDWDFDAFVERYTFLKPEKVLKEWEDVSYLYERYRQEEKIDFMTFMDDVFAKENGSAFWNAMTTGQMSYLDPYARLKMAEPLDLERVRNGESKYLIRELFTKKYPDFPVPEKVTMPRPVDVYFKDWEGPTRPEFKQGLDMTQFTGNQKWQLYCLEEFLNMHEPIV